MEFWIQFVNRFARTFFDFWRLRPRRFYDFRWVLYSAFSVWCFGIFRELP